MHYTKVVVDAFGGGGAWGAGVLEDGRLHEAVLHRHPHVHRHEHLPLHVPGDVPPDGHTAAQPAHPDHHLAE